MDEIMLITAQLELVELLVLEEHVYLHKDLESDLETFSDELRRVRDELLEEELKKRMTNSQKAWAALRQV